MAIRVELDARPQGRTAIIFEGEVMAVGRGAVVCATARKLVDRGYNPGIRLEAWRGGTLCLSGLLGDFARLTVEDGTNGRPYFRPHRPRNVGGDAAHRVISSDVCLGPEFDAVQNLRHKSAR